jgi:hypothetical protein
VDAEDAVQRGQGRACLPGRGGAAIWRDSRCRGGGRREAFPAGVGIASVRFLLGALDLA